MLHCIMRSLAAATAWRPFSRPQPRRDARSVIEENVEEFERLGLCVGPDASALRPQADSVPNLLVRRNPGITQREVTHTPNM